MSLYFRKLSGIKVFLFLMFPSALFAQPFVDILNIKYQSFPQEYYSDNSQSGFAGSFSKVALLLPIEQKDKSAFLIGGEYDRIGFTTMGENSIHTNLASASMTVGYDYQWKNKKWRSMALFIPKMNSDFKNSNGNNFQYGGVLLFNYTKNEKLHYHFGMYYNREFFGDYFMPLLGIEWKPVHGINVFGDLPNNLNVEIKASNTIYAGTELTTNVSSYRVNDGINNGYVREGDEFWGHDQVKLYLNYYLMKHVVFFAEGGTTLNRTFTLYDNLNKPVEGQNSMFRKTEDGLFFSVGVAYRYRLD